MENTQSLSTGASYLKRGYVSDPECHRTSHRLTVARRILAEQGVTPTVNHCDMCISDRQSLRYQGCWAQCKTVWMEVDGTQYVGCDLFQQAWDAACKIQDERGAARDVHRNEQLKAK